MQSEHDSLAFTEARKDLRKLESWSSRSDSPRRFSGSAWGQRPRRMGWLEAAGSSVPALVAYPQKSCWHRSEKRTRFERVRAWQARSKPFWARSCNMGPSESPPGKTGGLDSLIAGLRQRAAQTPVWVDLPTADLTINAVCNSGRQNGSLVFAVCKLAMTSEVILRCRSIAVEYAST